MKTKAVGTKEAEGPKPGIPKGIVPDMKGVPGELVDACPPAVSFSAKKGGRQSPYDPLLEQLRKAGAGKFLRFESLTARTSVMIRAKKLKIPVLFGEDGDTLYVSLGAAELTTEGVAEAKKPAKTNADVVLEAIAIGRKTSGEITVFARTNGIPGASITLIDGVLTSMLRSGKINIKAQKAGYEGPDIFEVRA